MEHDLILVLFRRDPRHKKRLCGSIVTDSGTRRKIVFPKDLWSQESRERVSADQLWRCLVLRDTKPEDKRSGALIVEPLKRIDIRLLEDCMRLRRKLHTRDDVTVWLTLWSRRQIIEWPELSSFVEPAVSRFHLIGEEGPTLLTNCDLGTRVGTRMVFPAERVGYWERTTFAYPAESGPPVRVTLERHPEPTTELGLKFKKRPKQPVWTLAEIYPHSVVFPMPYQARNTHLFHASVNYWSGHAFAYDPERMSPVFISSWLEVCEKPLIRPGIGKGIAGTLH